MRNVCVYSMSILLMVLFLISTVNAQQMFQQQCVNGQCMLVPVTAPALPPLATPVKSTARAVRSIVEVVLPPYPNVQNNAATRQVVRQMSSDCPSGCPASCTCGCQEQMMMFSRTEPVETITYFTIPTQYTTQRTYVTRSNVVRSSFGSGPIRSFIARLCGR